jgi:hypothetical protein
VDAELTGDPVVIAPYTIKANRVGIVVGGEDCEVVGESKYQRNLEKIVGGRTESGAQHKCNTVLIPEKNNRYDKNAIRVVVSNLTVGYLPRETAEEFGQSLRDDGFEFAMCKATIVGGWKETEEQDAGHFGIVLDACYPFEFEVSD